jgi:hypothetical protein
MAKVLPILLLADHSNQEIKEEKKQTKKKQTKKYYVPSILWFEFSLYFWFLNKKLMNISLRIPPSSTCATS